MCHRFLRYVPEYLSNDYPADYPHAENKPEAFQNAPPEHEAFHQRCDRKIKDSQGFFEGTAKRP